VNRGTRPPSDDAPNTVPLAKSRELAAAARLNVRGGSNPLEEKRAALDARRRDVEAHQFARLKRCSLGQVADPIESKGGGWRNAKHGAQWQMALEIYAAPLRNLPVAEVMTERILTALQPIWCEPAYNFDPC